MLVASARPACRKKRRRLSPKGRIMPFPYNYYIKLRIDSIEEVNLLLRFEEPRRNAILNKITFTYASQLGQSHEHFLTGKP
jgi:hypothetical protein